MAANTSSGETTEKSIREAAVKAIAKHGFEAASLRDIAKEVGIRAPSLYNYISSKEQLLYELMKDPLTSMLTEYRALVKEIDDPAEKLRVFVQVHLNFHLRSRLDVFIGNMEPAQPFRESLPHDQQPARGVRARAAGDHRRGR
jgi:AcrR family transcriptional regulator